MVKSILLQYFQQFYLQYRYILFDELIDYFALFGGFDREDLELYNPLEEVIATLAVNDIATKEFPFFLFENPFREFLITLARSDGKIYSLFQRVKIGQSLGEELVDELIRSDILRRVESRETPFQLYPKQMIKKEFRTYKIEDKLYFIKPFFRFWFAFIEPYFSKERRVDIKALLDNFYRQRYRLSSAIFEELSNELLKIHFQKSDPIVENGSLWNYYSEFDIFAKTLSGKTVIGECKYKNRLVLKSELIKLESKIKQSDLNVDIYALFSKSGFSKEFHKQKEPNLLLFSLKDFKRLIY